MAAAMNDSFYRAKSDEDRKEKFFIWLAAKVSPALLSELYDNQHRIDQFCLPRNMLKKPLFQNGDAGTIQKLVKELRKSLPFKLQKNVGLLFSILDYYVQYLQELEKERSIQTSQDPLIQALRRDGFTMIDRRGSNGCLWVIADREKTDYFAKWNRQGVNFSFEPHGSVATGNRAAWWTRFQGNTLPLTHAEIETIQEKEPIQDTPSISNEALHISQNEYPMEPSPAHEQEAAEERKEIQQETFIQDQQESLIQAISSRGLEYIDNRGKGGCLWVICGREESSFLQKWSKKGIHFYFASGGRRATKYRPAWWTTDALDSESIQQPENINEKEQNETSHTGIGEKKQEETEVAVQQTFGAFAQPEKNHETVEEHPEERNASDSAAEMQTMLPTSAVSEQDTSEETDKENKDIPSDQAIDGKPKTEDKQEIEHAEPEAVKAEQNQKDKTVPSEKMSEELWDFLSDAKYDPLRALLDQKKIWTVEQLISTDLWALLNDNNLYPLERRREIYQEIEEKLEGEDAADIEAEETELPVEDAYILSVAGKEYMGSTPSIALSKLCIYLAKNYPDSFPQLQDLPYNGAGPIVITKKRRRGKIWVGPPRGYIEPDLSGKDAAGYSQWLCRFCGAPWRPVVLKEPRNARIIKNQTKTNQAPAVPSNDTEQVSKEKTDTSLQKKESSWERDIRWVEETLLSSGMRGMSIQELSNEILRSKESTEKMVLASQKTIALPDRLIHESAFDTYPDQKEKIHTILEELTKKTDKVTPALLYLRVFSAMPQFLINQHVDNKEAIFAIALHFWPQLLKIYERQPKLEKATVSVPPDTVKIDTIGKELDIEPEKEKQAPESENYSSYPAILPLPDGEISESALIGWQEVKPKLKSIWESLLQSNRGKVTPTQLYFYVFSSMSEFLRINKLNNKESVYAIVQYFWPADKDVDCSDDLSSAQIEEMGLEHVIGLEKTKKNPQSLKESEQISRTASPKKTAIDDALDSLSITITDFERVSSKNGWLLIDDNIAGKRCDTELFQYNGMDIPKEMGPFFGIDTLSSRDVKRVSIVYLGTPYAATIIKDTDDENRNQIFWRPALGKMLKQYEDSLPLAVIFKKKSDEIFEISFKKLSTGQPVQIQTPDKKDLAYSINMPKTSNSNANIEETKLTQEKDSTGQKTVEKSVPPYERNQKCVLADNMSAIEQEQQFFKWLEQKVSPDRLMDFYQMRFVLFSYAKMHHLKGTSFFSIKDVPALISFKQNLENNKQFKSETRSTLLLVLLNYYIAYRSEQRGKEAQMAPMHSASVIDKQDASIGGDEKEEQPSQSRTTEKIRSVNGNDKEDIQASSEGKEQNVPIGTFYSWEIIDKNTAVKTCDKSFFLYNNSGVPQSILAFFGVRDMPPLGKKYITLIYQSKSYQAMLVKDAYGSRTSIYWTGTGLAYKLQEYKNIPSAKAVFRRLSEDTYQLEMRVDQPKASLYTPGKYGQWEIVDDDTAFLTCDGDCLSNHKVLIPETMLRFFGLETLKQYEFRKTKLIYSSKNYYANFYIAAGPDRQVFLSWVYTQLARAWGQYQNIVWYDTVKAVFHRKGRDEFAVEMLTGTASNNSLTQDSRRDSSPVESTETKPTEVSVRDENSKVEKPLTSSSPYPAFDQERLFFKWLEEKESQETISSLYLSISRLNAYCYKNKLCKAPLFKITDIISLLDLLDKLEQDKLFLKESRSSQMLSLIKYYIAYLRKESKSASNLSETIRMALDSKESITKQNVQQDTQSNSNKATRIETPTEPKQPSIPLVKAAIPVREPAKPQPIPVSKPAASRSDWEKDMRDAFYEWLKKKETSNQAAMSNYMRMRELNKLAQQNSIFRNSLYSIQTMEEFQIAQSILEQDRAFQKERDRCKRDGYDVYIKFLAFVPFYLRSQAGIRIGAKQKEMQKETVPSSSIQKPIRKEQHIIQNQPEPAPAAPIPNEDPHIRILHQYFPKGFQKESGLDMKRYRTRWEETYKKPISLSDDEIRRLIAQRCVDTGNRWYLPDLLLSLQDREQLLHYIDGLFSSGKRAVYYLAIYRALEKNLESQSITADLLAKYLQATCRGRYVFYPDYLAVSSNTQINVAQEITAEMLSYGRPMHMDTLAAQLPHVPEEVLEKEVRQNSTFLCNGPHVYFPESMADVTESELKQLSTLIQNTLDDQGFLLAHDLMAQMRNRLPELDERLSDYSDMGKRAIVASRLKRKFMFSGAVITPLGQSMNLTDMYAMFCKRHAPFTLDELEEFAEECNVPIYWDTVHENCARVSETQFVPLASVSVNKFLADTAIDQFCKGDYILFGEINTFDAFPYAGYPWNAYLLEQYVATISDDFTLMHGAYTKTGTPGVIMRRDAHFASYDEILEDALAQSSVLLQSGPCLDWLAEQGYISRKKLSNIAEIIARAKLLRSQKG